MRHPIPTTADEIQAEYIRFGLTETKRAELEKLSMQCSAFGKSPTRILVETVAVVDGVRTVIKREEQSAQLV